MRDRKIVDVYDGAWSSESGFADDFDREEYAAEVNTAAQS
jgi:hypothetical protein